MKSKQARPFSKVAQLKSISECEDTMERLGMIRTLCEATEEARNVIIRDDERGRLLVDLSRAFSVELKSTEVPRRLEILEQFCAKYNF